MGLRNRRTSSHFSAPPLVRADCLYRSALRHDITRVSPGKHNTALVSSCEPASVEWHSPMLSNIASTHGGSTERCDCTACRHTTVNTSIMLCICRVGSVWKAHVLLTT